MIDAPKTAVFTLVGRYGEHYWAVATVYADLNWATLTRDNPSLPKNSCVYQIGEFTVTEPGGNMWSVNIRYNIITECIEELANRGSTMAADILKKLRDGQ